MNSAEAFEEEFLCCKICFERFRQPKVLPCLHTFCLNCLRSYIKTTELQQNRTAFRCPTCREVAKIPDPRNPDFAGQFKTNFYVNSLMDVTPNSPPPTSGGPTAPPAEKLCPEHADKIMDLFCVDCDKTGCLQCSVISHRSCRQVIPVSKVAAGKKSELVKHRTNLLRYLGRYEQMAKELEKEKQRATNEKVRIVSLINEQSSRFIRDVQAETSRFLERLESMSKTHEEAIKQDGDAAEELRKSIKDTCDKMAVLIEGPDSRIFDGLERVLNKKESILNRTSSSWSIPVCKLKYESAPDLKLDWTEKLQGMSERQVLLFPPELDEQIRRNNSRQDVVGNAVTSPRVDESPFFDSERSLTFVSKMEAKMKGDKAAPCLRDIAVFPSLTVVVTDSANHCVKAFSTTASSKQIESSRYITSNPPHAIGNMSKGNRVLVTVPKAKNILLFCVNSVLVLEKLIHVSKKYWGVAYMGGEILAVSTCPGNEPGAIDLINLSGIQIKTVHSSGLFSNPLYLSVSSSMDIIVSDCTIQKVAALRQNGDVLFGKERRVGVLFRPMGIARDKHDGILIIDDSQTLVAMDEDGRVRKKFSLESKNTKKEVLRSVAVDGRNVFIITETSQIYTFILE